MSALSTIRRWVSPILDPLTDLPRHLNALQQNHVDSVQSFSTLMAGLVATTPSLGQFSGPAAEQATLTAEEYATAERLLSSIGGPVDELSGLTTTCTTEVETAAEDLAVTVADDSVIEEVAAGSDIAAVAEGGVNPIADAIALIADVILIITIGPKLIHFGEAIYDAVHKWLSGLDQINSRPQPKLPKLGGSGQSPRPGSPMNQLTQEQQEALQRLKRDFPDIPPETLKELLEAGFTEQEIRDMIRAGFTNVQFKTLLTRIQAAQANGTDQYGVTAAQLRDIATRVAAALNSGDKGRILEGRTALAVLNNIVAFQKKVIDPNTGQEITDIDVETSTAIIQVTTNKKGKLDQTQTTINNPWVNPTNKPVIVFAPNYSRFGIPGLESTGAHYAKTLDDVKRLNQTLHP